MKGRLLYLGLCTLVLAGIVHIAIVLLVPVFGKRDAARQIVAGTPLTQFVTKTATGKPVFADGDPFFEVASCRFDLEEGGLAITGAETGVFWSLAVFNERGRVVYSLGRRSAIGNRLNMIIVDPVQMARLRQFDPDRIETSVVVETRQVRGYVVVRILRREVDKPQEINAFLESLSCEAYLESGQV